MNAQPPSAEAVKAAFMQADLSPYREDVEAWTAATKAILPFRLEGESSPDAAARILAAHARAREAEVARLRGALETIAANPGNLSDDKCRFASGDIARKALTGEASA